MNKEGEHPSIMEGVNDIFDHINVWTISFKSFKELIFYLIEMPLLVCEVSTFWNHSSHLLPPVISPAMIVFILSLFNPHVLCPDQVL